jgi:DNA-binding NtrC family response regulator
VRLHPAVPQRIRVLETPDGALGDLVAALRTAIGAGGEVESIGSARQLIDAQEKEPGDLVLLDYLLGDGLVKGADLIAKLRAQDPDVPLIAVAERGDVGLAADAVQAGASDFLVRGEELGERVTTLLAKADKIVDLVHRHRALREQYRQLRRAAFERHRIVGASPAMREVLQRVERVARIPRPVLVEGERGTGKELVARAIHVASGRGSRPFIAVNCAAFPETLLESELFGHERGAFTGADQRRQGKFEQAQGGTLFLDEIGNMPLAFQQKVLRVVEYGTYTRLGGVQELRSDARIVAATNTNLEEAIARGRFLQDLYDRLAFEVVRIPPLREREGDIEILAHHFLDEFLREVPALGTKGISPAALTVLQRHSFPGNVRELKNTIERAAYRDTTNQIDVEDIDLPAAPAGEGGTFDERVEAFKRRQIVDALAAAGGNQTRAAQALGLTYDQLRHYYRTYGLGARRG